MLIGYGQVNQHDDHPGVEPVDLMVAAARAAADPRVLEAVDSVRAVSVLSWRYRDPGLLLAQRLRASPDADWLGSFLAALHGRGYARLTIQFYLREAELFGGWLRRSLHGSVLNASSTGTVSATRGSGLRPRGSQPPSSGRDRQPCRRSCP